MKFFLFLGLFFYSFFFIGCDCCKDDEEQKVTSTNEVEVFTLAPVVNAIVKDANGQIAVYDDKTHKYKFKQSIIYPVSVEKNSDTFIDIDYDSNKSSIDTQPSFETLKSFCNSVNYLTSAYYTKNYFEQNISIDQYKKEIKERFDIDICKDTLTNIQNAIIIFGTYDYMVSDANFSTLDDINEKILLVDDFFKNDLETLDESIDKIKYYSVYDALVNIDKKFIKSVDTLHKPFFPSYFREEIRYKDNSNETDVFDIAIDNQNVFTASGHEELTSFDNSLNIQKKSTTSLESFGVSLYKQDYNNEKCLFLANGNLGVSSYDISSLNFIKKQTFNSYKDSTNKDKNITNLGVNSINGYISSNLSKRLLAVSTQDNGLFLINIKDNFSSCNFTKEINQTTDFLIQEESSKSISTAIRDDGTYLYTSHQENGISGYDISILNFDIIKSSKNDISLYQNQEAYNLKLVNNDNELFISTDKGLLIYDVGSNPKDLTYISFYETSGAQKGYRPQIDFYDNYIFFTDGYQGLKVLKLDNSFNAKLCGLEYFSPKDKPYELAKVTSVKYQDDYLYIGISSFGIVKLKFKDILFNHCK
jgi:hypothetical protein